MVGYHVHKAMPLVGTKLLVRIPAILGMITLRVGGNDQAALSTDVLPTGENSTSFHPGPTQPLNNDRSHDRSLNSTTSPYNDRNCTNPQSTALAVDKGSWEGNIAECATNSAIPNPLLEAYITSHVLQQQNGIGSGTNRQPTPPSNETTLSQDANNSESTTWKNEQMTQIQPRPGGENNTFNPGQNQGNNTDVPSTMSAAGQIPADQVIPLENQPPLPQGHSAPECSPIVQTMPHPDSVPDPSDEHNNGSTLSTASTLNQNLPESIDISNPVQSNVPFKSGRRPKITWYQKVVSSVKDAFGY
ncbi:hypothetical protein DL96DRAFT_722162 [Flagelloscypha sp. PMI_526]|nr:hypothetical protein DL96DRAFT_722162 [Flagelloscypha sp. PMI_526]